MKKIFILLLVTLLCGNIVNAKEVNIINLIKTESSKLTVKGNDKTKDYNFFINKRQLGKYLDLNENDSVKSENVYSTYESFCNGMQMAGSVNNEETRLGLIFNSIDYTIKNMRVYLDRNQYRKFLKCLNMTLYNKGFLEETCLYGERNSK